MVQVGRLKLTVRAANEREPLIGVLRGAHPLSQSQARELIRTGKVQVRDAVCTDWRFPVPRGAEVSVDTDRRKPSRVTRSVPPVTPDLIVYRDDAIVVVNKPAGIVSVPPTRAPEPTLLDRLQEMLPLVLPVHRLDRDTSGLMVFALGEEAAADLRRQFAVHSIERAYYAVVEGRVQDGELRGRIDVTRKRFGGAAQTRTAVTRVETVRTAGRASLLICRPGTGRFHQIRIQLALCGAPIAGEREHLPAAFQPTLRFAGLALQSFRLVLTHPVSLERMTWELPLVPELERLLDAAATTPV